MTTSASGLVLGLDIGGTSTRAVVADLDGTRRGHGRAAGANLTSHAADHAFDAVAAALEDALSGLDPTAVVRAVIGTAGDRNLSLPDVAAGLRRTWHTAGLTCEYRVVSDAVVAFVAGTAAPDGTLLLSGTGALACRITDRALDHAVDGHGWLLGDLGSGYWLGHQAVRCTLRSFDQQRKPGPLGRAVLEALLGSPDTGLTRTESADLVVRVHSRPPIALAELAPLVTANAGTDPEADRILSEAAGHLLADLALARATDDATPIVLAGSLLATDTALAELVVPQLRERWPDAEVGVATDGAAAAAWLAALEYVPHDEAGAQRLHQRLVAGG